MLDMFKKDLLYGYGRLASSDDKVIFRTVDTDNGYQANTDIVLEYTQFNDGFTVFAVNPELMRFAKEFTVKYSLDLFGLQAFEHLFEYIETSYISKHERWLYRDEEALEKYMVYYGLGDKHKIDQSKIQPSTVRYTIDSPYRNITDEYQQLSPDGVYFGTLIGDEIVSITGTNGMENEVVDIGVETHIAHRQKGYALSNITALSEYLLDIGRVVKYGCNNLNVYSNKAAISCGFEMIAKEKTIWCPPCSDY